jgi:hypothetical protein
MTDQAASHWDPAYAQGEDTRSWFEYGNRPPVARATSLPDGQEPSAQVRQHG